MFNIIFYIISTLISLHISNERLKKTPIGKIIFSNTELIYMKVLFWRADSTLKNDMKKARNLFQWTTITGVILILLGSIYINCSLIHYIAFITLLSFVFWEALSWGMSPFKETINFIKLALLLALIPLIYYIITLNNPHNGNLFFYLKKNIQYLGIDKSSNFEIALYITSIILILNLAIYLIWFLLSSVIISIFISLSWSTSKLSKIIIEKNGIFWLFCIVIILGIIRSYK